MSRDCKAIINNLESKLDQVDSLDSDDVDALVRAASVTLGVGGSAVLERTPTTAILTLRIDTENRA